MLGNKLVNLRKEKKLSQDALADKLGVTDKPFLTGNLILPNPILYKLKIYQKYLIWVLMNF